MYSRLRFIPMLCVSGGLLAQSVSDLNSLILQAKRFAGQESSNQKPQPGLSLYRIIGTGDGGPGELMRKPVDLQQWTLMYQIDPALGPAPCPGDNPPQSATVLCSRGVFRGMLWSTLPIFDCKCLEWVWLTVTIDDAIAQLNHLGFTRGFTSLTVMRPLHPRYPDECTYVFKCAPDHAFVGISAQTGAALWTEPYLATPDRTSAPWPEDP